MSALRTPEAPLLTAGIEVAGVVAGAAAAVAGLPGGTVENGQAAGFWANAAETVESRKNKISLCIKWTEYSELVGKTQANNVDRVVQIRPARTLLDVLIGHAAGMFPRDLAVDVDSRAVLVVAGRAAVKLRPLLPPERRAKLKIPENVPVGLHPRKIIILRLAKGRNIRAAPGGQRVIQELIDPVRNRKLEIISLRVARGEISGGRVRLIRGVPRIQTRADILARLHAAK